MLLKRIETIRSDVKVSPSEQGCTLKIEFPPGVKGLDDLKKSPLLKLTSELYPLLSKIRIKVEPLEKEDGDQLKDE